MKRILSYSAVIISLGLTATSTFAQTTANGPYYATPSWDQQLPASTRFIVLSNWGNAAVLDRETGLVWERSPTTKTTWDLARALECVRRTVGGRMGWRLPSVHELASLVDPNNPGGNPALTPGHPFSNVKSETYWSATSAVNAASVAWGVFFGNSPGTGVFNKDDNFNVWCVRGGMNADVY